MRLLNWNGQNGSENTAIDSLGPAERPEAGVEEKSLADFAYIIDHTSSIIHSLIHSPASTLK